MHALPLMAASLRPSRLVRTINLAVKALNLGKVDVFFYQGRYKSAGIPTCIPIPSPPYVQDLFRVTFFRALRFQVLSKCVGDGFVILEWSSVVEHMGPGFQLISNFWHSLWRPRRVVCIVIWKLCSPANAFKR